ncbi:MAG: PorP/SprF family type IX secretion system membrane protein [Saprospiraceae bacterium]|nr:PorP/SprF family type IX secretion system membrane protein [Saprospiraceae bacterium]
MRIILLALIMLGCNTLLNAQQLPFMALFRENWNLLNPAAPSDDYIQFENYNSIGTHFRKQWVQLEEAPTTALLNGQFVLDDYNILTGGHLVHDQTGKLSFTGLYGNFAYRLAFNSRKRQYLYLGLNLGILQYRANLADILFDQPEVLQLANEQVYRLDAGFGAFYQLEDQFYVGLSIPQSLGIDQRFQENPTDFELERVAHAYFVLGGFLDAEALGRLEPTLWLRFVPGAPFTYDLNVRSHFSENFWLGVGGGLSRTLRIETGFRLGESLGWYDGQLKTGVSVGIPMGTYGNAFGMSGEVHVGFSW